MNVFWYESKCTSKFTLKGVAAPISASTSFGVDFHLCFKVYVKYFPYFLMFARVL